MAKGQHLSKHQRGIVNRYYEHRDTIALNTLGEIVSELYLADSAAKQKRLWDRAEKALANLVKEERLTDKRVQPVVQSRDLEGLAELIRQANAAR